MANNEALRELQSRLAERLQAARTQARPASWLAVECGGHGFLFPLQQAGEIFPSAPRCRCRTRSPGSSASPTCAAACTAWSTWRPSSASSGPRRSRARRATSRGWSRSTRARPELRAAGRPPGRPAQRRAADARPRRPKARGRRFAGSAGTTPTAASGRKFFSQSLAEDEQFLGIVG